jgi:uncharacterized integral membrane protein
MSLRRHQVFPTLAADACWCPGLGFDPAPKGQDGDMSSSNEAPVPPESNLEPLPPHSFQPEPLPSDTPSEPPAVKTKPVIPPNEASKFTRAGALWSALAIGFLLLVLLLVFIVQNGDTTTVHLFGWAGQLPVGIALLLAAVAGGLLTFLVGTARIIQLRRAAKKNLKAGL